MTKTRMPESHCPRCDALVDGATAVDGGDPTPRPGDFSVCAYCASVLCFTDKLTVREATREEKASLAESMACQSGLPPLLVRWLTRQLH